MPRKTPPAGVPLASLLPSWELSLQEANRSPKTIASYKGTADRFIRYLKDNDLPDDTERVDAPHLRAFLLAESERTSPVSAAVHYRNLRVLFGWLEREGERSGPNPMARVDEPKAPRKVKQSLTTAQLAALLKACGGADFEARRDTAMLRILIDTGVRVSGLAGIRTADVNLAGRTVAVTLKGGEQILIPLGKKAAAALDRYLRARARHPHADSEWLWLGLRGHHVRHFGVAGDDVLSLAVGMAAAVNDAVALAAEAEAEVVRLTAHSLQFFGLAVSQEARDRYAKSGVAMDDGAFPIKDAKHLGIAKAYFHQGKLAGHTKSEVRAHINRRAKALGLPGLDDDEDHDSGHDDSEGNLRASSGYGTVSLSDPDEDGELDPDSELSRLAAQHSEFFGLAGRRKGRTHVFTDDEDTQDHDQPGRGNDVHAKVRAIIDANPDLFAPDDGRFDPNASHAPKSRAQRAREERRARTSPHGAHTSYGGGSDRTPLGRMLMPSRYGKG